MVRLFVCIVGALLVAGCNVVVTPGPLFSLADQAGGPPARLGVWRFDTQPDCSVDEKAPIASWPMCANALVIEKDGMAGYFDRSSGAPVWTVQPLIMAAGAPRIVQVEAVLSGDVKITGKPFLYLGARATKSDDQGRITAMTFWPVQCGPPGPDGAMTKRLLPGLTAKPTDPVCTTSSTRDLRAAAGASEAWAPKQILGHWVRDGGP